MKYIRPIIFFLSLSALSILVTNCTKESDPETLRKEAATLALNSNINADSLKEFVTWMQGFGTRFALSEGHRNVAIRIKNCFKRLGYNDTKIDSFRITKTYKTIVYQQWQYNVIATLEGSDISDSVSIMGGHYDNYLTTGDAFAIIPGANDNASGVAAALEVARVMKKNNYTPKHTILFIAFGSEEMGLYGSQYYASDARTTLKKIKVMLNNDMIAYEPDNNSANWSVNIIDYANSHILRAEAETLCRKYTGLNYFTDNTYSNASDSYPFSANGFEALFFFSKKMDPNYHSLNDIVSNCNFEYCREIVRLNCAILVNKN